jgi:Tol biopolymer transport system component
MVYMAPIKPGSAGGDLVTMNLDGSNRTELTDNKLFRFLPHFSPDGTRLVYTLYDVGSYGDPKGVTNVAVYDFATKTETRLTSTGTASQPVWSPDGQRIAFGALMTGPATELWMMNADGSSPHKVAAPSGTMDDRFWGDIAWSSDDWILFVVAQTVSGCFKVRSDKIRPDGSSRTKVSEGGPNCTPQGMEQAGDADPGFSADGKTVYSSRGFPQPPANPPPAGPPPAVAPTERKLYAFSSDAWFPGKPERDLSLPSEPDCIEGVPKGSPDGKRVLLFRHCFVQPGEKGGIFVTDSAGSYRTFVVEGFGPDWNPVAR